MTGRRMGFRELTGWTGAAIASFVLTFGVMTTAFAADPTPEQLRDRFDTVQREVAKILRDIERTQNGFQATYNCPPSQTKKQDNDDLNQINGRINAVAAQLGGRGRSPGIAEQNEALGTAGEGQGLDRFLQDRAAGDTLTIPESLIQQALRDIQTARNNLGRARQDLNSRPKTARECEARFDPIGSITWAPGTGDPGAQINSTVSATTRSGKAVTITAVTANVSPVSTGGANIGGLGGAAVNVGFKIDDVKRQGPHTLTITVTGRPAGMPASAGTTTSTHRVSGYRVNNVAPTITTLPTGPVKEPGEALSFDGQLVVVDRNADDQNANELTAGKITFQGHPPELDTNPGNAFQTNTQARKVGAHNPTTGTYTFEITRKANAKKPHKHGKFPVTIRIEDKEGRSVTSSPIDITIKNVAPQCTLKVSPKRKYHANDGIPVVLSGSVSDENGKDDIEKIEVDARQAGGGLYTKANGNLVLTDDGDSGFTFVTNPDKFGHPNARGTYPIPAFAEDNGAPEQGQNTPEKGTCDKDIEVGNDPPRGSGSGYIYDIKPGDQRIICPNEVFRAGAIFVDPEGDPLAVEAEIGEMKAGQFVGTGRVPMTGSPGSNTYIADLRAPAKPGTYVIRFYAKETNQNPPLSAEQEIALVVSPCPGEETAMIDPRTQPPVEDEDKPEPPALCGTATVQQQEQMAGWATGFWDWLQQAPASDAASASSGATGTADAAITPADTEGGLDYAAVDENWGLSLGVKYGDTQMFTMKLNPLINYSDYTVGLDEDADSFDVAEAFRDLNIPVLDGASLPSLLDFGTFSPAGGGATGSTPGIGAFGTSLFGTVGPGGATNYMPRAPSIGELFGGDVGGSIFTDGFESGDTSAWSSGLNGAPASSAGNGAGAADTFGSRVRLNFDTSFTGQDVLRTRLENTPGVSFVEDGFCRQALRPNGPPTAKAQFRQPAPPVEDFLKDPNAMRTWDPATDGAPPGIGELDDDGSNLPQLLNQHAPNYRCGQPLEISLADSLCNTATTTVGR
ncbi:MAG: hypothetical protein ACE363_07775 [Alphaproteobacteria bacterium]